MKTFPIILLIVMLLGAGQKATATDRLGKPSTDSNSSQVDWAAWTSEKINENPVGYLEFAKKQLEAAQSKLEERHLALKIKHNTFTRKRNDSEIMKAKYGALLDDLRKQTKAANDNNSWPITLNGKKLSKEESGKLALKVLKEHEHQTKLKGTYQEFADKLNDQIGKVENRLSELRQKRNEVDLQLEVALFNKQVDELSNLPVDEENLKIHIVSLRTKRNNLTRKATEAKIQAAKLEKLLNDLKKLHVEASGNDSWPVKYRGVELSKSQVMEMAVKYSRELKSQSARVEKFSNFVQQLDVLIERVEKQLDKIK